MTLVFCSVYTSSHASSSGIKSSAPLQNLSWVYVLGVHTNLLHEQPISSAISLSVAYLGIIRSLYK